MQTSTPEPTLTPTATATPTPPPGGVITGRVYLLDRDEPVLTSVSLVRDKDHKVIEEVKTDADGKYTLIVTDPDTYAVNVKVTDLLDKCDHLRSTSKDWPVVVRTYNGSGPVDVYAGTKARPVAIDDTITIDLDLNCD